MKKIEVVLKNAAVISNDLKKIAEFFKCGKMLHNYKKFDFSDCPLGNYLTEIEEKILKKELSLEDQSFNFLCISTLYINVFCVVDQLKKTFGGFLIELSRQEMVKEIDEQITRAQNLFDAILKKQSAEHQIKKMSFVLM